MDAAITNLSTEAVFIPGPNIDIPAGETASWPDITVSDLDGNAAIKALVVAGTISVAVTPDAADAAAATSGSLSTSALERYTVAALPTGYNGRVAYATNGRSGAEGAGAGTGVPVIFSNLQWRRFEDMAVVAA